MTEEIDALFARRPWQEIAPGAMAAAADVPTMLSDEESRLYFWLTAHWASGIGEVVDLGCFAGGSTARLAEGLRQSGHGGLVHAFDRFEASGRARARFLAGRAPATADRDILPLVQEMLAPWDRLVTFYRGDIGTRGWNGGPIEILVVDAAKSGPLADHIAAEFFPALVPGGSILVQQDFLHPVQPWLPAQMAGLAGCFRPLAAIPRTGMVFLCTARPDAATLAAARTGDMDDAEIEERIRAWTRAHRGFAPRPRIAEMVRRLRAHPGERVAWKLRRD